MAARPAGAVARPPRRRGHESHDADAGPGGSSPRGRPGPRLGPAGVRPDLRRPRRSSARRCAPRPAAAATSACTSTRRTSSSPCTRRSSSSTRASPTACGSRSHGEYQPADGPRSVGAPGDRDRRLRRDQPDLPAVPHGARRRRPDVEQQPVRAAHGVSGRHRRRDRHGGRHRHRHRPRPALRRPGERLQPVVPGGRPDAVPARGRRPAGALARRGVHPARTHPDGPVGAARQRRRHRALRADGLRSASRCSASSARTPSTNGCSRPRMAEEELAQLNPYARIIADEAILRGIAVQVLDAQGRLPAAHPRRHQRRHPGVAVRADQRGRHEPMRRQARRPQGRRRRRDPGAAGRDRDLRPTRTTSSSRRWARSW